MMRFRAWCSAGLLLITSGGCGNDSLTSSVATPTISAVTPASGATAVQLNAPITIEFTHSMPMGAYLNVDLHEGDIAGPVVQAAMTWSADYRTLTLTPAAPLKSQTQYTIHVGGGLRDASGRSLDFQHCARTMGGEWTGGPRGMGMGGMMGGTWSGHMSPDWRHANGSYGMVFSFTTA